MNLESLINKMVKRYVITSAQMGASVNRSLLQNIDKYCSVHDAELIILPLSGKSVMDTDFHKTLQGRNIISGNYKINNSLMVSNYSIKPQQINPLTGIKRFAQGDKSFIFGSPKQVLQYVSNSYDIIPKAVMTTGCVTKPYYRNNRIGNISTKDHEYGFVVVEKESNKYFHFRQVKALNNGSFTDLNERFINGKKYKAKSPKALIIGDLHPYDTNPIHEKNTFEQIKYYGSNMDLFLHDTFNGRSISHHYLNHNIRKHEVYREQGLNLKKELEKTLNVVNSYAQSTRGNVYIVTSNHDEHLYRYLDEGRFIGDKGNDLIGSLIYTEVLRGNGALESGLKLVGDLEPNVMFIPRDIGHKVLGYELGNHGDLGSNGGRGSPRSIEDANAKSVTGHGHSAFKIRNTYRVGTSTNLRLDYNRGYSNWTNTNAVLNADSTIQLLNTINKKWKV